MGIVVNLNGVIVPAEEARISVFDRGFLFGDSVYETLRSYAGRPFMLSAHLRRLASSANGLGIELPWPADRFTAEVEKTLGASGNTESRLRIIVTRGEGPPALVPLGEESPNVVIVARPFEALSPALYEEGVEAAVVSVIRNAPRALDPNIKSGNFLNNILAAREAASRGAFEGIMLSQEGTVAEATTSNIFVVHQGRLATPHGRVGLLRGITRELVLRLAAELGEEVAQRPIPEQELREAEETFITSTLKQILPVTRLDGAAVGSGRPGAVTVSLMAAYRDTVERFVRTGEEPF